MTEFLNINNQTEEQKTQLKNQFFKQLQEIATNYAFCFDENWITYDSFTKMANNSNNKTSNSKKISDYKQLIEYYYFQLGEDDFLDVFREVGKERHIKTIIPSLLKYAKGISSDKIINLEADIITEEIKRNALQYNSHALVTYSNILTQIKELFPDNYAGCNLNCFENIIIEVSQFMKTHHLRWDYASSINLLGNIILYSTTPSLNSIYTFLELLEIEDRIDVIPEENRVFRQINHGCDKDTALIIDYGKPNPDTRGENLRTLYEFTNPRLTLEGQTIFYKISEVLKNLSLKEKENLINLSWWSKNGYFGFTNNTLSQEIQDYYIYPAIYGTPPPEKPTVINYIKKHSKELEKLLAYEQFEEEQVTLALNFLAKLPLNAYEVSDRFGKKSILSLISLIRNYFADDENIYTTYIENNKTFINKNILIYYWLERCTKYSKYLESEFGEKRQLKK